MFLYCAAFLFYVADALQKKTSFKINTWSYLKIRSFYSFPLAFIVSGFITGFSDFPYGLSLGKLVGASVICALGLFFYIKAINHIHFSNVGSLSVVGNVFQWLLGWIFLHESISWLDLPAMLLMFSGSLIQLFNTKLSKGAYYVLLCSFFWVSGFSLLSVVLKNVNIYWSIPIMEGTILGLSLWASRFDQASQSPQGNNLQFHLWLLLIAAFIYGGSILNHFAYLKIPVSTISLLQLSLMPLGYLLSLKLFREKASTIEWVSFVLGLVGFAYLYLIRHLLV